MTTAVATRRAFLGTLGVPDGFPSGAETVVEWTAVASPDHQKLDTPHHVAYTLHRALSTRLKGQTLVVGPADARLGTAFEGGTFESQIYLRTDINTRKGRLVIDDALMDALSQGLADAMTRLHLHHLGKLDLPSGVPNGDAVRVADKHLSLRLVVCYDIRRNTHVVRIDVLGAP